MKQWKTIEQDIALAHALADAAGMAIRPYYRSDFALETKEDSTPVTLADRAAEKAMRALLERVSPQDGIIGEEYGTERSGSSRLWVLDPIDGTASFVAGRPIFGTLIALLVDGWPILGIIDQPISGERWIGVSGRVTLFNERPARTRCCRALSEAVLCTTSPHAFSAGSASSFMGLAERVSSFPVIYGGDCYNYGLVASGHVDIVCEDGLKLHDYAALVPVVEGAGGTMCDWSGAPLHAGSEGSVIALGDSARLDDVLEGLASGRGGAGTDTAY